MSSNAEQMWNVLSVESSIHSLSNTNEREKSVFEAMGAGQDHSPRSHFNKL